MSKARAPFFPSTVKPATIFGLDPLLVVLLLAALTAGLILLVLVAAVFASWKILTYAPWILGIIAAAGIVSVVRISARNKHYLPGKRVEWVARKYARKAAANMGAVVLVLLAALTVAGAAAADVNFRPPPGLDMKDWLQAAAFLFLGALALSGAVYPSVIGMGRTATLDAWEDGPFELDRPAGDKLTVILKDGGLARVIRIKGLEYSSRVEAEQSAELHRRTALLVATANTEITIRWIARQYRVDLGEPAVFSSTTLQEIGDAERAFFAEASRHEFLMIFTVPAAHGTGFLPLLRSLFSIPQRRVSPEHRRDLNEVVGNFLTGLAEYGAENIEASKRDFCDLSETFNALANGSHFPVAPASRSMSGRLGKIDYQADKTTGVIRTYDGVGEYFQKILVVKQWGDYANGNLVRRIMEVAPEVEVVCRARPMSTKWAKAFLFNQEKQATLFGLNPIKEKDFQDVRALVDADKEVFFTAEFFVMVKGRTVEEATAVFDRVRKVIARDQAETAVATRAAEGYWLSRFPGFEQMGRPLHPLSSNLAALFSFSSEPEGMETSPWTKGDGGVSGAIRRFKTARGGTYAFQWHVHNRKEANGHYLVIAPTDSGKSTLVLYLMAGQARNRNVKGFMFDSKEGGRFMVEAMGGRYFNLNDGEEVSLNPLQIADNQVNRAHLTRLFKMMAQVNDDKSLENIDRVVASVMRTPNVGERSLNTIQRTGFDKGSAFEKGMKKWVIDPDGRIGPYAHLLNGETDSLARQMSENFLTAWNADEILREPEIAAPVFEHISHVIQTECASGGYGFNIFVDEAAALLRDPTFQAEAKEMYREFRKLNGVVGLAFQEPTALRETGIADAVIGNCGTFLLFPNTAGNREDYATFDLNDEQWKYIKGHSEISAHVKRSVLLIKRDKTGGGQRQESVILDVDLEPVTGEAIRVFQSGPRAVNLMRDLQREFGKETLEWVNHV